MPLLAKPSSCTAGMPNTPNYASSSSTPSSATSGSLLLNGGCALSLRNFVKLLLGGDQRGCSFRVSTGSSFNSARLGGGGRHLLVRCTTRDPWQMMTPVPTPTSIFDMPPSQGDGRSIDLLNLALNASGDRLLLREAHLRSDPVKQRIRQGSDTTELQETVTMEAIARTLQMQLQQERQVLTREIQ